MQHDGTSFQGAFVLLFCRLKQSLGLAIAASDKDWDWLRLRRPRTPPPLDEGPPPRPPGPFREVSATVGPVYRWFCLSIRSCGRDGAAALRGAASGVYANLIEGADCLRLVARRTNAALSPGRT